MEPTVLGAKGKMPPPKPQKLLIPTPKCQHTYNRNTQRAPRITMTPEEVIQYCEWICKPTDGNNEPINETHLTQTANAAAGYIPKAVLELITYLHTAAGYPIKQTWIKAIQRGHYI